MADSIQRYLLRSEVPVIQVRRHWAALTESAGIFIGAMVLLVIVNAVITAVAGEVRVVALTSVFFFLFLLAWFVWELWLWYVEVFVVTDKRVLLVSGIITRRVAIMPLVKVTDLTFERSLAGQLLGYGAFVMESAGQRQALSRINYLPHPEDLYHDVSDLLFGTKAPLDEDERPPTRPVPASGPDQPTLRWDQALGGDGPGDGPGHGLEDDGWGDGWNRGREGAGDGWSEPMLTVGGQAARPSSVAGSSPADHSTGVIDPGDAMTGPVPRL